MKNCATNVNQLRCSSAFLHTYIVGRPSFRSQQWPAQQCSTTAKRDIGKCTLSSKEKNDFEECSIENLDACLTESESNLNDLYDNLVEFDENDEECSIDDLDACVAELDCDDTDIENNERCIDNLDACGEEKVDGEVKVQLSQQQSLRRFLANPIVEVQLAGLVLLSSLFVGLGTLSSLPPGVATVSKYGELLILVVFTVEYILRWKLENFSAKYIVQPAAVIDLIAILPGLIKIVAMMGVTVPPSLLGGALINLRLLRILRLQRVLKDFETFKKFEMALGLDPSNTRPWMLQLARVVISIFTLLSISAGLIYSAEHNVNPDITDYFTALYFALTTLTTVGFGDLSPMTVAGRCVVCGSILVGSAVVPAQAAALVEALINREGEEEGSTIESKARTENEHIPSMEEFSARMERLEIKVDETNERIDRLLTLLENKDKDKT